MPQYRESPDEPALEHLDYAEDDHGVATITFTRPESLNSLTFAVYRELRDVFPVLAARDAVRVVVIRGTGRGFCTGGDVNDIIGPLFESDAEALLNFTRMTGAVVENIRRCPKPVIAGLNGVVAGAGAAIATACDLRVAADTAKIAFLFVKVGLSGADMGMCFLLPRIVGLAKATELLMCGEFVSADEAARLGLYNAVVPPDQFEATIADWAARLAKGPRLGLQMTKELLNSQAGVTDWHTAIEAEAQAQALCMQHPDFREAYDAFVAKRPPRFA